MSLNWDMTEVENFNDIDDATMNTFILLTPALGIREVTRENVADVFARISIMEDLDGGMRWRGDEHIKFTFEEVEQFIGLKVNVAQETKAQFIRRYVGQVFDERKRKLRSPILTAG